MVVVDYTYQLDGVVDNVNSVKVQLHSVGGMMWGRTDGSGIRIGSTDTTQVWFRTGNQYAGIQWIY